MVRVIFVEKLIKKSKFVEKNIFIMNSLLVE